MDGRKRQIKDVLVIGAGLAGLSTAYFLAGQAALFEKEADIGGLCRTYSIGPYDFDITGHLLHGLGPGEVDFLHTLLLPIRLKAHTRRASVFYKGRNIPYPFQANLHHLPPEEAEACIRGLTEAGPDRTDKDNPLDFRTWCYTRFGQGIANRFMIPYNEKMWGVRAEEMTADWATNRVPTPTTAEVRETERGEKKDWGYNASFYYPQEGGIGALAAAFARHCPFLYRGRALKKVDICKREVHLSDGSFFPYRHLVSTIPLPLLIQGIEPRDNDLLALSSLLRWTSVWDINIAVNVSGISDQHWIYFPEKEYCFYRVGFPMNFAPHAGPVGTSTLYVEVSHTPGTGLDEEQITERALGDLKKAGILDSASYVKVIDVVDIPFAYVIYNRDRQKALKVIMDTLGRYGIYSIGRFGGWGYTSMWETILQGRDMAHLIREREDGG